MLADLQTAMRQSLLSLDGDAPAGIVADGVLAEERFDIYRRSVILSLEQCLADAFPATEALLGRSWFRPAARAFARHFPPEAPQLSVYGKEFPSFLAANGALEAHEAAADLAQIEWARMVAYFAADAPVLDRDLLARIGAADATALRLIVHPSFTLQPLVRPSAVVLSQLAELDGMLPVTEAGRPLIGSFALRSRAGIVFGMTGAGEYALLSALADGTNLGDAADIAWAREATTDLQAILGRHIQLGSFSSLG